MTEFKLCSEVLLQMIVTFMKQFLCRLNTIAGGKQQSDVKGMSYKSDSFVIICDVIHIKNIWIEIRGKSSTKDIHETKLSTLT